MKRLLAVALFLFGTQLIQAQFFKKNVYYEGEIGGISSLFVKDAEGDTHIFAFGGLSFRGGVGVRNEEGSLFLGLHSGIEGNFRHGIGIFPAYVNSRVVFRIADDIKGVLSFGYGKSFQVGPENLKGYLRKYTIGIADITQNDNMQTFFIEINNHGFNFPDNNIPAITFNVGYTYTFL